MIYHAWKAISQMQGTALVFATIGLRILDDYPVVAPVITIEKCLGRTNVRTVAAEFNWCSISRKTTGRRMTLQQACHKNEVLNSWIIFRPKLYSQSWVGVSWLVFFLFFLIF